MTHTIRLSLEYTREDRDSFLLFLFPRNINLIQVLYKITCMGFLHESPHMVSIRTKYLLLSSIEMVYKTII